MIKIWNEAREGDFVVFKTGRDDIVQGTVINIRPSDDGADSHELIDIEWHISKDYNPTYSYERTGMFHNTSYEDRMVFYTREIDRLAAVLKIC